MENINRNIDYLFADPTIIVDARIDSIHSAHLIAFALSANCISVLSNNIGVISAEVYTTGVVANNESFTTSRTVIKSLGTASQSSLIKDCYGVVDKFSSQINSVTVSVSGLALFNNV